MLKQAFGTCKVVLANRKPSYNTIQYDINKIEMRIKGPASRARFQPLRIVMVVHEGKEIMHIYWSRDSFKQDELARYKKRVHKKMKIEPKKIKKEFKVKKEIK